MILRFQKLTRIILLATLAFALVSCSNGDGSKILGHWRAERIKLMSLQIPIGPEFIITQHDLFTLEADMHIPITSIAEDGNEVVLNFPAGLGLSFYFDGQDRIHVDIPFTGKIYYRRVVDAAQVAGTVPATAAAVPVSVSIPVPVAALGPASDVPANVVQSTAVLAPLPTLAPTPAPVQATFVTAVPVPSSGAIDLVRQGISKMNGGNLAEAEALLLQAKNLDGKHPMVEYNLAILKLRQFDNDAAIGHLRNAFNYGFRAFALLDADPDFAPLKSDVRYQVLVSRYQ